MNMELLNITKIYLTHNKLNKENEMKVNQCYYQDELWYSLAQDTVADQKLFLDLCSSKIWENTMQRT